MVSSVRRRLSCLVASFLVASVLVGCSGGSSDAPSAAGGGAGAGAGADAGGGAGAADVDPCAILDDALLTAVFAPGDAEVTRRPSTRSPHPLCSVSWPKPNREALVAEQQRRMQEMLQKKARGEETPPISSMVVRTEDEVSLTVNKTAYASDTEAAQALEGIIEWIAEGVSTETEIRGEKRTVSFSMQYEKRIDGVGELAAWSSKMRQLSVAAKGRIFHLTVHVAETSDEDLELARKAALAVIERL